MDLVKEEVLRLVVGTKEIVARELSRAIEAAGMKSHIRHFVYDVHARTVMADVRVMVPFHGSEMLLCFTRWALTNWPVRGIFTLHLSGPRLQPYFGGTWKDSLLLDFELFDNGCPSLFVDGLGYYRLVGAACHKDPPLFTDCGIDTTFGPELRVVARTQKGADRLNRLWMPN